MTKVLELNDDGLEQLFQRESGLILVDFYAPWCGPCRRLGPVLDQLAHALEGRVKVVKVNIDHNPYWANRLGVRGVPALFFVRAGRIVERIDGLPTPQQLVQTLQNLT